MAPARPIGFGSSFIGGAPTAPTISNSYTISHSKPKANRSSTIVMGGAGELAEFRSREK